MDLRVKGGCGRVDLRVKDGWVKGEGWLGE